MNTYCAYVAKMFLDCTEHFSNISRKIRVSEKSSIAASTFPGFPLSTPSYPSFTLFPSVTFQDSRIFKGSIIGMNFRQIGTSKLVVCVIPGNPLCYFKYHNFAQDIG